MREGFFPSNAAFRETILTVPNFFIAGAAKCGTTSLHAYLKQHPDVFMSDPKEPRFFDTDMQANPRFCVRDPDAYAALFTGADNHKIVGEASPSYLVSEVAAERIYQYNSNARVLITLRHPIDFMFSLHRQFVESCNEDLLCFEEALAAEPERAKNKRIPKAAHFPGQLLYRHNARFAGQVERYLNCFGPDQVKVVLMEDLAVAPARTFDDILNFLGLSTEHPIDLAARNRGNEKRLRNFRLRSLMKRFPILELMARKIPVSIGTRISDAMVAVTGEQADAHKILALSTRQRLTEEFRKEIRRLEKLIDRDLSHWLSQPKPSQ